MWICIGLFVPFALVSVVFVYAVLVRGAQLDRQQARLRRGDEIWTYWSMEPPETAAGLAVRACGMVQPGHFWIGCEEA